MTPEPAHAVRSVSRRRGWLAALLALAAFAFALSVALQERRAAPSRLSLTAGAGRTTRELVARALASELTARGFTVDLVPSASTGKELSEVDSGSVDFGLVSGAFRVTGFSRVREVTPLFTEALHLLVKQELAEQVGPSLRGLRGRRVDLGPRDSATASLAAAILEFAGLSCAEPRASGDCTAEHLDLDELDRAIAKGDREALPDAVFHLATVPSTFALRLVREQRYALVPLSFANAFRLGAMLVEGSVSGSEAEIERRYTTEFEIPPYLYQTDPPVPPRSLVTVGARLVLVANQDVPAETVEEMLDAIFQSRFARLPEPPLQRSLLRLPARLPLHDGTHAFLARDRPLLSASDVGDLANAMSLVGALLGGGVFLWQSFRQRLRARRDELFGSYQLRIASVEGRIAELELAANLELEDLIGLQRDLLQLKSEALARYAAGELGGQTTLTDLLVPLNAARDHVGDLLLHVRERLEERAEAQGRSAEAVWEEAAEGSEEPAAGR